MYAKYFFFKQTYQIEFVRPLFTVALHKAVHSSVILMSRLISHFSESVSDSFLAKWSDYHFSPDACNLD